MELFGAYRCMVSSKSPVDKAGFRYRAVWNMFKHISKAYSDLERSALFSKTAQQVYRMA